MRKRMLQNIDWMFRHFVGYLAVQFLIVIFAVAAVGAFILRGETEVALWAAVWVVTGTLIGSILCYFLEPVINFLQKKSVQSIYIRALSSG